MPATDDSSEGLSRVLEAVKEGITLSDESGRFEIFNSEMERLTGYSKQEANSCGDFSLLLYPDPNDRWRALSCLKDFKEGDKHEAESVIYTKGGEIRDVLVSTTVVPYHGRKMFLTAYHDITERKKAEQALLESEGKYRSLVETTSTGYVILDSLGHVLDANKEYVNMAGYETLDELKGRSVTEWTAAYDQERNAQEVGKCFKQGYVRDLVVDYIHKDGKTVPIELNATVVKTEQGLQIITLCRDITDRKQAEEALQERLRREEILEDISSRFVRVRDLDSVLNYVLEKMGEGIDVSRVYLFRLHDSGRLLSITHEWVGKGVRPQIKSFQGIPVESMMWWIRKLRTDDMIIYGDIEEIPDEATKNILRQKNVKALLVMPMHVGGGLYGFIGLEECHRKRVWHDENVALIKTIGEIISMGIHHQIDKEKLEHGKCDLEGKVEERTRDLRKALAVVKESDKMKDDFLAITSHELKTPLTPIILYTELLQQNLKGLDSKNREFLDMIHMESLHLRDLILDILELAKLDARQKVFDMKPARIDRLIEASIKDVEPIAKAKNIKISTEVHRMLPEVFLDEQSIHRVMNNLLTNALKFSPDGSTITIKAAKKGKEILISVRDNGIGISKKNQGKVFDRFFQAEETRSREHGGTGLGLAIAKGIIDSHRGRIWLKSKLKRGSTFYFTIPLLQDEEDNRNR
ncbi:MAG: PAS domain S-box protein [Candidatus Altiarchaeota archaeon]